MVPTEEDPIVDAAPNPFLAEGEWLKTALHTHTIRSDGDLEPEAHVSHHEWMGFDVVAITDHWTLTSVKSRERIVTITGAELAVDPLAPGRSSEILAIGIDDIPEDPGGDRAHWEPIDNYFFKTFPDYPTAAAAITSQGGAAFVCHPYWSGLPLETIVGATGVHGLEVFNASAERDTGRGDSSYMWDLALESGMALTGIATDDCHYPGFDIGDAWTMVRAAERSPEAVVAALRAGAFYASAGPAIVDLQRSGDEVEVVCGPASSVVLHSSFERGTAIRADHRGMQQHGRILERDDASLVRRARLGVDPRASFVRVVVTDTSGRSAWTNTI